MRFRGLLLGLCVALCGACGDVDLGLGVPEGPCGPILEELDRAGQSGSPPLDSRRLEELAVEAPPCMSESDLASLADAWFLRDADLPASAVECLEPAVGSSPGSFVVVVHNQMHRLPSEQPHHEAWVAAMAECVPASYVLSSRLPSVFADPESLACLDREYEPANLLPFFDNINTFDERVAYSDWPEDTLRTFYGPMYRCADFVEMSLGSDFIAVLSTEAMMCIEQLPIEFLLFTRETVPQGYHDSYRRALDDCVPASDVQALRDAGF